MISFNRLLIKKRSLIQARWMSYANIRTNSLTSLKYCFRQSEPKSHLSITSKILVYSPDLPNLFN